MNYKSDTAAALHSFKISRTSTEWLLGYGQLLKRVAGSYRILDFGCGSAWFGQLLAEERSRVDGVDLEPTQVELARSQSPQVRSFTRDEFIWPAAAYDVAIANFVFCEYDSGGQIGDDMKLICRSLKLGGKLYILHANWDKSAGKEFRSSILNQAELYSGAPIHVILKGNPPIDITDYFWSQEDYRAMLLEAGFQDVVIDECMAPAGEEGWLAETESSPLYIITATK
jgi:SAM-dependent methyltransferase